MIVYRVCLSIEMRKELILENKKNRKSSIQKKKKLQLKIEQRFKKNASERIVR